MPTNLLAEKQQRQPENLLIERKPKNLLAPQFSGTSGTWDETLIEKAGKYTEKAINVLATPPFKNRPLDEGGSVVGNIAKDIGNLAVMPITPIAQVYKSAVHEPLKAENIVAGLEESGKGIIENLQGFGEFFLNPLGFQAWKKWAESGFDEKTAMEVYPEGWKSIKEQWSTHPVFSALGVTGLLGIMKTSHKTNTPPDQIVREVQNAIKEGVKPKEAVKVVEQTIKEAIAESKQIEAKMINERMLAKEKLNIPELVAERKGILPEAEFRAEKPSDVRLIKKPRNLLAKKPSLIPMRDTYLTAETNLVQTSKQYPKASVIVKDVNGQRASISLDTFIELSKEKGFTDRIRQVLLKEKGVPERVPADFMEGILQQVKRKALEGKVEERAVLEKITEPIEGVKLTNNSTVMRSKIPLFEDASRNLTVRKALKDYGIKEVRIEPPYKFSLSEEANISMKDKIIRINADAINPKESILHEIGHSKYEGLTKVQREAFKKEILTTKEKYRKESVVGYMKLGKWEEIFADDFAMSNAKNPVAARLKQAIDIKQFGPGSFNIVGGKTIPKEAILAEVKRMKQELAKIEVKPVEITKPFSEAGFIRLGKAKETKPEFTGDAKKVEAMYERATEASKVKKQRTKNLYRNLKRSIVDVSGNLKKKLMKQGDLGKEVVMRHDLIAGANTKSMRDVKIASDKIFKGLNEVGHEYLDRMIQSRRTIAIEKYKKIKHPEGLGRAEHEAWMKQLPENVRKDLNKRADLYFGEMKGQLKQLLDEKIITKTSYDALINKGDYSPRQFLQHIDPEITHNMGGKKITVPDSGIKALKEGSMGLLEKSSSNLLSEVVSRTQGRIFKNRANRALVKLAEEVPDNGVVSIGSKKPAPTGFEKVKVMVDGQTKELLMPSDMAMEWIVRDPILTQTQASVIRWMSGSAILKPMATGLNLEFALANFPRDLAHIWITDYRQAYSPHLPVALVQMAKDMAKVSEDAIMRKGRWDDYINEGGGMEFLTHQGRITSKTQGIASDIQTVMGYFGETSEIVPRLALRERAIKQGYPSTEATWIARDYLDFSQGGNFAKAIDTGVPYLNASIQGTRGLFRAGAMKPALFTYKVAQIGALATSLYYMNRFLNEEAWEQVSPRDKVNNFIITTPYKFKDKEGNERYFYFKIAKDQGQRVFTSIFEGLAAKAIGDGIDGDQIAQSVQDALPIIPSQNLPPTLNAFLGYAANKDFWRNEDIWRGPEIEPKEEYTAYTHDAFVKLGQTLNMSPVKLKYALSRYFTSGNVYTSIGGYSWNQIFNELPEADKHKVTEEIILDQPFIRRIVKKTDPYYKHGKTIENAKIKANTERYKLTRKFDNLSQRFYDKEIDSKEVSNFIQGVSIEDRSRLRKRHRRRGRLQEIPEKRWWLNIAEMTPEVRATVYWNRWRVADDEERKMLEKYKRRIPGLISTRFIIRFNQLKRK